MMPILGPVRSISRICQPSFYTRSRNFIFPRFHSQQQHSNNTDHHHSHSLFAQHLTRRGIVEISGPESADFLQGLITNDIFHLNTDNESTSLFAGILNPHGRLLYDLILYKIDKTTFWAECDTNSISEFIKILKRHKLRKKIDIENMSEGMKIWSIFGDLNKTDEPDFIDQKFNLEFPQDARLGSCGWRLILPDHTRMENTVRNAYEVEDKDLYRIERYRLGIAEGVEELPPGKAFPLESNFIFLNGVSFTKGCFVGQELTARTYHTGVTRKRIMPVEFTSTVVPDVGAKVRAGGKDVGTIRAVCGRVGLAMIRIGGLSSLTVRVEEAGVESEATLSVPPWWPLDDNELKKIGFTLN